MGRVDVLVPTCRRPAALAVALAGLAAQTHRDMRVVVSDQTEGASPLAAGEVQAVARVLRGRGVPVDLVRHLPRRGLAEHRQSLLDRVIAPWCLFLDDDVLLEPDVVERMLAVIAREGCGFVGQAPLGLSHAGDRRPHQQAIELWDGPVRPERVTPGAAEWARHHVHSAANLLHVAERLGPAPWPGRTYRVAWVGGCVMFDGAKLRAAGGFGFWRRLPPEHAGEDVLAQLRVMERFGGCGLLPSGAYHLELPTTVADRTVDAPIALAG